MSCIDYGAILKVNGKFINKNYDLFMDCSDTGYVCEKATYFDSYEMKEKEFDIDGNYYVYAGDEEFMLCFYKGSICVISHNRIIHTVYYSPFLSETFYINGFPHVKVEHLDKNTYIELESLGTWSDYIKENWIGATGDEKLSKLQNGKRHYKWFRKRLKSIVRERKHPTYYSKYKTSRWKATWDYNGNHYEVIFGCGIDPNEDVWNRIKFDTYNFTDIEREIIDEWFRGA